MKEALEVIERLLREEGYAAHQRYLSSEAYSAAGEAHFAVYDAFKNLADRIADVVT